MIQTIRVIALDILLGLACLAGAAAQETNPVKLVKGVITDTASGKPVDGGMIFAYIGAEQEPSVRSRINPKTEGDNPAKELTAQRIEALKEYLASQEIDTDRITWKPTDRITASTSSKKRSKASAADTSLELTGVNRSTGR